MRRDPTRIEVHVGTAIARLGRPRRAGDRRVERHRPRDCPGVARAGADVALTYRSNRAGADAVAREIEALGRTACVQRSIWPTSRRSTALAAAVRAALGRLDVWVNNAGADILTGPGAPRCPRWRSSTCCSPSILRGTILASWAAARFFAAQRGRRHHQHELGSRAERDGRAPIRRCSPRSKAASLAFSTALARSVAPRVRVNVLAPGWIETAFGEGLDSEVDRVGRRLDAAQPLGHARRRGRRRRVSRLAGGRVHHRADDPGRRRRRDGLASRGGCQWPRKKRPTTRRRLPRS